MAEQIKLITEKYPFGASLFLVFSLVLALNSLISNDFKNQLSLYFKSDTNVGGELTEIVSAPSLSQAANSQKENSLFQSALAAAVSSGDSSDVDLESAPYNESSLFITGEDSILQNQNPIIVPAPEPAPTAPPKPVLPYYAAGPYLDGYFIFPTSGFNRGRLHAYNAVDISHGSDCLAENIPVYAAASGIVSATYHTESANRYANGGYGNNILVLHTNGVLTRYAHLKEILVSAGQYVNQGGIIAYMGGYPGMVGAGNSTGCHLHFEVRGAKNPFAQ